MTFALFLLAIGLLALHVALAAEPTHFGRRVALAVAGVAALPLAFGPIVPISHFIFEATGRPMRSVTLGVVTLMLAALAARLVARRRGESGPNFALPIAGVLACAAVWLGSAALLSDHEQGKRTPDVWDAPIYVVDWLAAVAICGFLSRAAWRTAQAGLAFRLLIGACISFVALLVVATVNS